MPRIIILFISLFVFCGYVKSQSSYCDSDVPTFLVDLRGNPDSTYTTPDVERDGKCCDAAKNAPCVQFEIYLDKDAQAIQFDVCVGAKPSGALYYQIDCGVKTPVGDPLCLEGEGPFYLTFCKPGKNDNVYCIKSLPRPVAGPDITLQEGCGDSLTSVGFSNENVSWTSIFPGNQGDYDYLLNCTFQCPNVEFVADGILPDYIDYTVCGYNIGGCDPLYVCDTVRVNITDAAVISFELDTTVLCTDADRKRLKANIVGGTPPYNIIWNTGETTDEIMAGGGTYTVTVTDGANCAPISKSITVAPPNEMTLTTVVDPVLCNGDNSGRATVSVVGGFPDYNIQWSDSLGQTGTVANDLPAGVYDVVVTDSVGCSTTTSVEISEPADPVSIDIVVQRNVSCKGGEDGYVAYSGSGGVRPYTYQLNSDGSTSDTTLSGLKAGFYTILVKDANGCTSSVVFEITEPEFALDLNEDITPVACFGENSGSVTLSAHGGTPAYSYSQDAVTFGLDSVFTDLVAGSYWFYVKDANGCTDSVQVVVEQPLSPLAGVFVIENPKCFSSSDGSIQSSITGGTSPYVLTWSNGSNQAVNSDLPAGNYTLHVVDQNGCAYDTTIALISPPELVLIGGTISAICEKSATGKAYVTVSGGTQPYTYQWDDVFRQKTDTAYNLLSGSYSVTVTDANGCQQSIDVVVSDSPSPLEASIFNLVDVACFGESTGILRLDVTGGKLPYTYVLSPLTAVTFTESNINGGKRLLIENLPAGTYSLLVTDNNGCNVEIDFTIEQPEFALEAELFDFSDVKCFGEPSGTANVLVNGGTLDYTYLWSSGLAPNGPNNSSIPAGNHNVIIEDANGCRDTLEFVIDTPTKVDVTAAQSKPVSCFGNNDGVAFATGSGGVLPYNFQWNDFFNQTSDTAYFLSAGTYKVLLSDANGCLDSADVVVTEPLNPLTISLTQNTAVTCFGLQNASASVIASGGTGPYSYIWNDPNNQTGVTASNLGVGVYRVTVTDANGCTETLAIEIVGPSKSISLSVSILSHVSCFGMADGSAKVFATGGTQPYTYQFSPNGSSNDQTDDLTAGIHRVTVTDANGCSQFIDFEITEPSAPLTVTVEEIESVSCKGYLDGIAQAFGAGGTLPYSFQWNDPNNQSSDIATSLGAGVYQVVITDKNGCQDSAEVTISEPNLPLTLGLNISAVKCKNGNDGEASVLVNGGTAPFTYLWNDPLNQKTPTARNLSAGTYDVTVTDANGCNSIATAVVTEPSQALSLVPSFTNPSCSGATNGEVSVVVSGGTPPYAYQWNDPSNSTSSIVSNLPEGEYEVVITDANQCVIGTSIQISEPNPLLLTIGFKEETCAGSNNGIVSVSVNGGTAPYTFVWDDQSGTTSPTATGLAPGTYNVTVTDGNGCSAFETVIITATVKIGLILIGEDVTCFGADDGNIYANADGAVLPISYSWSPNGSTQKDQIDIPAGTYTLNIIDGDGCPASTEITISEPNPFSLSSTASEVSCFGFTDGTAEVFAAGATAPYNYAWNDINGQTTKRATGLGEGNYTVTVTDSKGCSQPENVVINSPNPIAIGLTPTEIKCFGESDATISSTVTGGTPAYQYSWNDINNQSTPTATNLPKGNYELKITDANLCIQTATVSVQGPQSKLNMVIEVENVTCKGLNNGRIISYVSGGTTPYTYSWSHDAALIGGAAGNLSPAFYTLTVTDAKGCVIQSTVDVSEPNNALSVVVNASDIKCKSDTNGTATLVINGGIAPYFIDWKNPINQNTVSVSGLDIGLYQVEVTDKAGCSILSNFEISEPSNPLDFDLSASNVLCFGNKDAIAWANNVTGTAPFQFNWNDGLNQKNDTAFNLTVGNYMLTVIDNNGCSKIDSIEITQPDSSLSSVVETTDLTCYKSNDGSLSLNGSGGTVPYSYWVNSNPSTPFLNSLSAGIYSVRIVDANNCEVNKNVVISEPDSIEYVAEVSPIRCKGENTGSIVLNVKGGIAPYEFVWSADANEKGNSLDSLGTGTVTVIITDGQGCESTFTTSIIEPASNLELNMSALNAKCFGGADGQAVGTVTGGVAPYYYQWNDILLQQKDTAVGLPKGVYTLSVVDNNGCELVDSIPVLEPSDIEIVFDNSDLLCYGDSNAFARAIVTGGVQPYTYKWNDPNEQTSARADGLKRGTFIVNVTDNNACNNKATIVIDGPAFPITLGMTLGNVKCKGNNDGWAKVNVSGGTGTLTYVWNAPTATNADSISSLPAGTYSVEVFDENNCSASIQFRIDEPNSLIDISIAKQNILCFGLENGTALATVNGGRAPYKYEWNDQLSQTTRKATGLKAGLYQVIVIDDNGCVASKEVEILAPNENITLNYDYGQPLCNGDANGWVEATASKGTAPYEYKWNVGGTGNTQKIDNLPEGMYYIDVIDFNGCQYSDSIALVEPNVLLATKSVTDVACAGLSTGKVGFIAQGGTPNYTYTLNGSTQNSTGKFSGLSAGLHFIEVKDRNGCLYPHEFVIQEPVPLAVAVDKDDVACFGERNGGVRIIVEGGGTPAYSISFNNGAFIDTTILKATTLNAGSYPYIVRDQNGCFHQNSIDLSEPNLLNASAVGGGTFCVGQTVNLTGTISGGTPTYTFHWTHRPDNSSTVSETPTTSTNYYFQGFDANGCKTEPLELQVVVQNIFDDSLDVLAADSSCFGDSYTVEAIHFRDSDPSDYSYTWTPNIGTTTGPYTFTTNNNRINYVLTVTDVCGNEVKDSALVTGVQRPEYILPDTVATACAPYNLILADTINQNTGSLTYSWFVNGVLEETSNVFVRNFPDAGEYNVYVEIETLYGCKTTASSVSKVLINHSPDAYAEVDKSEDILRDATFKFYNLASGYTSFYWTFGDGDTSFVMHPEKTYTDTGTYQAILHVLNSNGCPDQYPLQLKVNPYYILVVPSGFSPGGNQGGEYDPNSTDNDVFYPFTDFVRDYEFKIFNRWGELVFVSNQLNIGWDGYYKGKLAQQDVYIWKLNITYTDGFKVSKTGDVTLFRK